jgi:DNA modification methylase
MQLLEGDCLIRLKGLKDSSVDSIVTDPPAGISFMGKSWDTDKGGRDNWIKWMSEVATECKRVLKPGGHAFVWAIPRTSHWTATAWENAGFEIRDVVAHVFGSGFPKSLSIGKAVDKIQGNEREDLGLSENHRTLKETNCMVGEPHSGNGHITKGTSKWEGWGTALKPAREDWLLMRKPLEKGLTVALNVLKYGTGGINIEQSRVLTPDDEARKQKILAGEVVCNAFCDKHGLYPSSLDDMLSFSQQQLLDFYQHIFSELGLNSISYKDLLRSLVEIDYKKCTQLLGVPYDCGRLVKRGDGCVSERQEFLSFQAYYPTLYRFYDEYTQRILVCDQDVFPLNSDVQSDILHFLSSKENNLLDNNPRLAFFVVLIAYNLLVNNNLHNHYTTCKNKKQMGRFPSNLIHDNSEEVRECFPESKSGAKKANQENYNHDGKEFVATLGASVNEYQASSGNASRFFKSIVYVAKASKSERNRGCEELEDKFRAGLAGADRDTDKPLDDVSERFRTQPAKNNHPTVKPIALMEYLIKMVTPKGGTVLDPFMGSGSTGVACIKNGFDFIGIDMTPEYIEIAKARIAEAEKEINNKLL